MKIILLGDPCFVFADRTNAKSAFEGGGREGGESSAAASNDEGRFTTQFCDGNGDGRRKEGRKEEGRGMTDGPKNWPYISLALSLCLPHDIDTEMRQEKKRWGGGREWRRWNRDTAQK